MLKDELSHEGKESRIGRHGGILGCICKRQALCVAKGQIVGSVYFTFVSAKREKVRFRCDPTREPRASPFLRSPLLDSRAVALLDGTITMNLVVSCIVYLAALSEGRSHTCFQKHSGNTSNDPSCRLDSFFYTCPFFKDEASYRLQFYCVLSSYHRRASLRAKE